MQDRHTWVFVKGREFPLYSKYYYTKVGQRVLGDVVGDVVLSEFFKKAKFGLLTYGCDVPKSWGGVAGSDPCKTQKQEAPLVEQKLDTVLVSRPVVDKTVEKRKAKSSADIKLTYTASDPSRSPMPPRKGPSRKL
jgi:hypothetical protein